MLLCVVQPSNCTIAAVSPLSPLRISAERSAQNSHSGSAASQQNQCINVSALCAGTSSTVVSIGSCLALGILIHEVRAVHGVVIPRADDASCAVERQLGGSWQAASGVQVAAQGQVCKACDGDRSCAMLLSSSNFQARTPRLVPHLL